MALADYLQNYLGQVALDLGWTSGSASYGTIIEDTLALYGVESEDEATDTLKLRSLAKLVAWGYVMATASTNYAFSADGATFNRNQFFEMAKSNYLNSLSDCYKYLPDYDIQTGKLTTEQDPYSYLPYEYRDL
jgi:hypothetical protein